MNIKDQARLAKVLAQANELLDKPANAKTNNILNIDVLEALLGDVGNVMANRDPSELAKLIKQDQEG